MDARETRLLDLLGHAVFVLEPGTDGLPRYAAYNKFALNVLGKTKADVIGLTAAELFPGRLGKVAYDHHVEGFKSGSERSYEILLPLRAGQRRVRTILAPDLDDRGKVIRLIGSSADISGSQLIDEVRANAETMNSEIEDFVSLAAHDLRAPMRHVTTIANMLREDFKDMGDGKLDLIDMLEDVGVKAMSLIGDVLSHAQSTSTHAEYLTFNLSELLDEIMGLLDPMLKCDVTAPKVHIEGDRTAVQMILRNLIENAMKATENRQLSNPNLPKLRLALTVTDADDFFEIGVRDNGVGFGETAVVFMNGGKLRTGSGFGMLGVRRLVHARGGTLMATNTEDNSGALVSFSLPGRIDHSVAPENESMRLPG